MTKASPIELWPLLSCDNWVHCLPLKFHISYHLRGIGGGLKCRIVTLKSNIESWNWILNQIWNSISFLFTGLYSLYVFVQKQKLLQMLGIHDVLFQIWKRTCQLTSTVLNESGKGTIHIRRGKNLHWSFCTARIGNHYTAPRNWEVSTSQTWTIRRENTAHPQSRTTMRNFSGTTGAAWSVNTV